MRITEFVGVWLRYRDSAHPVEVVERQVYSFANDARECLVSHPAHLQWLLSTGRYAIVGVEVAEETPASHQKESVHATTPTRPRGRPRK